MFMRWYYWPLFAFVMGIALGGNVVAAFVQPIEQTQQAHPNQSANEIAVSMSAEERIADYTWTLDILTGVLAIATVGLLVATAWGIFQQSRETQILQRAYIGVKPGGIVLTSSNDQLLSHVVIHNAGNLPANRLQWVVHIEQSTDRERRLFEIERERFKGNHFVTPGGEMIVGSKPLDLPLQATVDWRNQNKGTAQIYVWGLVRYFDGFTEGRETYFCHRYYYGQTANAKHYTMPAEVGRYHSEGNAAT